jgi:ESS family glutamate:Na+ symporter
MELDSGVFQLGASRRAFIIVPLACAFFIDLVNALLILFFLARF